MTRLIIKSDGKVYVNEFPEYIEDNKLYNAVQGKKLIETAIECADQGEAVIRLLQSRSPNTVGFQIRYGDDLLSFLNRQGFALNTAYLILGLTFEVRTISRQRTGGECVDACIQRNCEGSCGDVCTESFGMVHEQKAILHYSEPGEEQLFDSLKSQKDFREKVREILKSEPVINEELCPTCHKAKNPWCSNAFHVGGAEQEQESQEAIFDDLFSRYFKCIHEKKMSGYHAELEIMKEFHITRKN